MSTRDRIGAAYHEAGHAVVASCLGLAVSRIEIGIDDDDAKGATDIADDHLRPLAERLALCAAGLEAQKLFRAYTHPGAGWGDYGKMIQLLEGVDEETSYALRSEGHQKAFELVKSHADRVERIAAALVTHGKLNPDAISKLLAQ